MSSKLTVQPEEPPPDLPLLNHPSSREASSTLGGSSRGRPPGYG